MEAISIFIGLAIVFMMGMVTYKICVNFTNVGNRNNSNNTKNIYHITNNHYHNDEKSNK